MTEILSDAEKALQLYAEKAVKYAKDNFNVDLDYTENSLERLEEILEKINSELPKFFLFRIFKMNHIEQMSNMMGCYLGEVIRRIYNASCVFSKVQNVSTYELSIGELKFFPVNKVWKRIMCGKEENIVFYYMTMKNIISTGEQRPTDENNG